MRWQRSSSLAFLLATQTSSSTLLALGKRRLAAMRAFVALVSLAAQPPDREEPSIPSIRI